MSHSRQGSLAQLHTSLYLEVEKAAEAVQVTLGYGCSDFREIQSIQSFLQRLLGQKVKFRENISKFYWVPNEIRVERTSETCLEVIFYGSHSQIDQRLERAMETVYLFQASSTRKEWGSYSSVYFRPFMLKNQSVEKIQGETIVIMSDSQEVIQAQNSLVIRSRVIWECRQTLNLLGRSDSVTLDQMPGYTTVERNEKEDALASKGAATLLYLWIWKCIFQGNWDLINKWTLEYRRTKAA